MINGWKEIVFMPNDTGTATKSTVSAAKVGIASNRRRSLYVTDTALCKRVSCLELDENIVVLLRRAKLS
jgi:hypothetical protein